MDMDTLCSMNYYALFRVRSWKNGMRCMSLYILWSILSGQLFPVNTDCFPQYKAAISRRKNTLLYDYAHRLCCKKPWHVYLTRKLQVLPSRFILTTKIMFCLFSNISNLRSALENQPFDISKIYLILWRTMTSNRFGGHGWQTLKAKPH